METTVQHIVNHSTGTNALSLEVLFRKLILNQTELNTILDFITKLTFDSKISVEEITMQYTKCVKTLTFKNGVNQNTPRIEISNINKRYEGDYHNLHYSVNGINTNSLTTLAPIDVLKNIVLSYTFSFTCKEIPNWIISIAAQKEITNPNDFTAKLPEYKFKLLKSYETEVDMIEKIKLLEPDAYDYILFSAKPIDQTIVSKDSVFELIKFVEVLQKGKLEIESDLYQSYIYNSAKMIYNDPMIIAKYQSKSGFKRLVNNVVELNRTTYLKTILPSIEDYFITDKIDGKRAFLYIDEYFTLAKVPKLIGTDIKAISDKLYNVYNDVGRTKSRTNKITHIFDCEMIMNKDNFEFYVFDVIAINGRTVCYLPFFKRMMSFNACSVILNRYKLGKCKEFIRLTKDNYGKEIDAFYKKSISGKYEVDGLIFTPAGIDKKTIKFQSGVRPINTGYYNTLSFKWKPADKHTIDFYMIQVPVELWDNWNVKFDKSMSLYALCSGVNYTQFNQLQLRFFDGYQDIIGDKFNNAQYLSLIHI